MYFFYCYCCICCFHIVCDLLNVSVSVCAALLPITLCLFFCFVFASSFPLFCCISRFITRHGKWNFIHTNTMETNILRTFERLSYHPAICCVFLSSFSTFFFFHDEDEDHKRMTVIKYVHSSNKDLNIRLGSCVAQKQKKNSTATIVCQFLVLVQSSTPKQVEKWNKSV